MDRASASADDLRVEVFRDGKISLSRLTASCVVVDNITADDQAVMDFLATLNRHALGSAYAYDPQYRHIKATTCALSMQRPVSGERRNSGRMRCFSSASLKQRPTTLPPGLADVSPRPRTRSVGQDTRRTRCSACWKVALSQRADEPRQHLSISGDGHHRAHRQELRVRRDADSRETGLSLEAAFDVETALIAIDASETRSARGRRPDGPSETSPVAHASGRQPAGQCVEPDGSPGRLDGHTLWRLVLGNHRPHHGSHRTSVEALRPERAAPTRAAQDCARRL